MHSSSRGEVILSKTKKGGILVDMKERQKAEAIVRMKILQLHGNAINEFRRSNKLNVSEQNGALYWANPAQLAEVRKFEKGFSGLVYHVIHTMTGFGELLTMLYISKNPEEWEDDKRSLQDGYAVAYVCNLSAPDCSEAGWVQVQPLFGGVRRIA